MNPDKTFWVGFGVGVFVLIIIFWAYASRRKYESEESQIPENKPSAPDLDDESPLFDEEESDLPCDELNEIGSSPANTPRSTFDNSDRLLNTPSAASIKSAAPVPVVSALKPEPATVQIQSASEISAVVPLFDHSPDFRTIRVKGREWNISAYQAHVVKILWEYFQKGINKLHQDFLLEECEAYSKKMKDIFKGSKAWKTLIKPIGRGFYSLNLT